MFNALLITSLYVLDQNKALDFYVGKLGLEVNTDQDLGFMRWLTVNVPGDTRQILLAGKGHERSILIGRGKEPWDERAAAEAAIRGLSS